MAVEIKVPELGESVIEATVARWMKQEGDSVNPGEPLVELETDKVNLEVGAQQAGVLEKILVKEGETVQVGDALATLAPSGDGAAQQEVAAQQEAAAEKQPEAQQEAAKGGQAAATGANERVPQEPDGETQRPPSEPIPTSHAATPVALRAARELGVDIAQVTPTGSGGRVTREDVQAFAEAAKQPARPDSSQTAQQDFSAQQKERGEQRKSAAREEISAAGQQQPAGRDTRETRQRMTRRRQTIARRLVEAQQTAAMLTTFNEIDMSAVMSLRKRRREGFKEQFGVDLGFMSFFVKATVAALRAYPYLNAEIAAAENGGEEIVLKHYYDIGVAIGAEEGLVVPVIRDADQLTFAGIEKAIRVFVDKVKDGSLTIDDLRGGTFTITNGGVYGSLMSTPILNPPQVGILGMHAIKERAVVVDGEIVARPMMYVALSYDHRLVDGQTAVKFLVRLKELIEDPEILLFG